MSAVMSPCEKYRYVLTREMDQVGRWNKPALFIMLNPSTADAVKNDATISRCIRFADREGCTSLTVVNLFGLRSKDPKQLYEHPDPVGPKNDRHIREQLDLCRYGLIVAAWGSHGSFMNRGEQVRSLVNGLGIQLLAFNINKDGNPAHPLYQKSDSKLVAWETMA